MILWVLHPDHSEALYSSLARPREQSQHIRRRRGLLLICIPRELLVEGRELLLDAPLSKYNEMGDTHKFSLF